MPLVHGTERKNEPSIQDSGLDPNRKGRAASHFASFGMIVDGPASMDTLKTYGHNLNLFVTFDFVKKFIQGGGLVFLTTNGVILVYVNIEATYLGFHYERPPWPDRRKRQALPPPTPSREEVPGTLEAPLSESLQKIFAPQISKKWKRTGTSVPAAAASSSTEPLAAQPGDYSFLTPTYQPPDSASAEVLPPPAKSSRTEPCIGRDAQEGSALNLPTRYTPSQEAAQVRAQQEILAQAPVTPVSPDFEDRTSEDTDHWSQQLDPDQDQEYTGTSVPVSDPVGVQNVDRDAEASSEGEAQVTIAENGVPTPSSLRLPNCNMRVKRLLRMKRMRVFRLIAR